MPHKAQGCKTDLPIVSGSLGTLMFPFGTVNGSVEWAVIAGIRGGINPRKALDAQTQQVAALQSTVEQEKQNTKKTYEQYLYLALAMPTHYGWQPFCHSWVIFSLFALSITWLADFNRDGLGHRAFQGFLRLQCLRTWASVRMPIALLDVLRILRDSKDEVLWCSGQHGIGKCTAMGLLPAGLKLYRRAEVQTCLEERGQPLLKSNFICLSHRSSCMLWFSRQLLKNACFNYLQWKLLLQPQAAAVVTDNTR